VNTLNPDESQKVDALRLAFYEVVPKELRTFCALTSRISSTVLTKLGIQNELLPCQLWYTSQTQNFVVGFLNKTEETPEWNGHVVCRVGNVIIDTATQNLEVKLKVPVPWVVVAGRFLVTTQLIARARLENEAMLEWFYPPPNALVQPPDEPQEIIDRYSALLFDRISNSIE